MFNIVRKNILYVHCAVYLVVKETSVYSVYSHYIVHSTHVILYINNISSKCEQL